MEESPAIEIIDEATAAARKQFAFDRKKKMEHAVASKLQGPFMALYQKEMGGVEAISQGLHVDPERGVEDSSLELRRQAFGWNNHYRHAAPLRC